MQTGIDVRPKTDGEIHDLAMDEWLGQLVRLWDAVGKPLEADRLGIYQRELAVVPLGLLEKAVSRVIRENTYNNVPAVGIIWKALRVELGGGNDPRFDDLQAIKDWEERLLNRCVIRFVRVAVETDAV